MKLLHLSDLHFGYDQNETSKAKRKVYMDELLVTFKNLAAKEEINYIFFTGDFAWKSKKEEFFEAESFIKDIIDIFNLSSDNVFMCPGNHDVDRASIEDKKFPKSQHESNQWLSFSRLKYFDQAFENYISFCKRLGTCKFKLEKTDDGNYLTGYFQNDDLNLICLNSAWYAQSDPVKDSMWIGSNFISEIQANNTFDNTKPTIAIVHHPYEKWHEEESHNFSSNINIFSSICELSDLILSGHTHETRCDLRYAGGACYTGTGALYHNDSYENSFYVYELSAVQQRRVRYYIHDGKWREDDAEKVDAHKLKSLYRPFAASSTEYTGVKEYDKIISAISYKSLDSFALKAYSVEKSMGYPKYKKTGQKQRAVETIEPFISVDSNLMSYSSLLRQIQDKIENNEPIVLQGMQGTGKSTLMSFIYIDILNQFRSNDFSFYPVYIDIHKYMHADTFGEGKAFAHDITEIHETMSKEKNVKWFIILDGIDKYECSSNLYEKSIEKIVLSSTEHIVLCIGTAEDINCCRFRELSDAFQDTINKSKLCIYLNSIDTKKIKIEKTLNKLKDVYGCNLTDTKINQVNKWVKRYCNGKIDYRTILMLFKIVSDTDVSETSLSHELYKYHSRLIATGEKKLIHVAADVVSYITSDSKDEVLDCENIIHRNKLVRDYLLSHYWASYVQEPRRPRKQAILDNIAHWRIVFPRTVNHFILDQVDSTSDQYISNLIYMYSLASNEMKINIAYFLGRTNSLEAKNFLLERWYELENFVSHAKMEPIIFHLFRTITISLGYMDCIEIEEWFLKKLIEIPFLSELNLSIHCSYYYSACEYYPHEIYIPCSAHALSLAFHSLKEDLNNILQNTTSNKEHGKKSLKLDIITFFAVALKVYSRKGDFLKYLKPSDLQPNSLLKTRVAIEHADLPSYLKDYARMCLYACSLVDHDGKTV